MTESPPAPPPPTASGNPGTEVPPLAAFAWRHRLVRPVQGRTFAGVCGALARATNTDVVLWRVILVVLFLFVGVGLVIYLIGWLLLPADGDTATPVEALAGRGYSRTSSVRTIVGLVIAGIVLAGYLSEPWRATPVVIVALLAGVLLLLLRDQRTGSAPSPGAPLAPGAAPPPFAPHGPFAVPPPVPPGRPGPPPVRPWVPPPAPPRPPSPLGLLTLSVAVLVLGGLFVADLSGYSVVALAYVAAPLAVLGLGLLVGTWLGRGRWLIPLGILLVIALASGAALDDRHWNRLRIGEVTWSPTSVSDIDDSYRQNMGDLHLDLSDVDFSGRSVDVRVEVDLGNLTIDLPSDVDVTVDAAVDVGNAEVLDESWSGLGSDRRTVTDLGADGEGGGDLHITAIVNVGNLEVTR